MYKPGDVIKGMQFPETVELKKFDKVSDDYYIIEALGRQTSKFYELMLSSEEVQSFEKLNADIKQSEMTVKDLQHFLQYNAFVYEDKYSSSRALGGKKLMPLPHQIEAVYGQMLQMPRIKFLLADDPGAGKTIMAGMLIKELMARQIINRILILVPPLVLVQWQEELHEKFNLSFSIINRGTIKNKRHNPFIENDFCLASMFWVIRDDVKALILEADFNLVIIDEAHKMAAYTHGKIMRKVSRTKLYQFGESLLKQTENCLLLTATPHKGDVENFRHFMCLLDYDIFSKVSAGESLKEKSNPFIIRRLKESLTNFDGTPLFPKRTTKTIKYTLSDEEKEMYEEITNYVRFYFNRAVNNGSNSTAFAMMLLQRRLSSSMEAIFLSLKRRHDRLKTLLEETVAEREKTKNSINNVDLEQYNDEDYNTQESIEGRLESATESIDIDELQNEINELIRLIEKTEVLRMTSVERKYLELERTLFGSNGLLNKGEKILIFTESVDTLLYLENKLLGHVDKVTKIMGRYSIDERRRQVELFKDSYQIMLATDAGGESINLQFCNQMINYDIPWNPNRLEQRMGRIHRIGQRNEVFVFNLVARNTREGNVMIRLLEKMEQMREDLGADLVYDFIGEILEESYHDLPTLMQQAIINRESLDDIISGMGKVLSDEHKKLLAIYKKERLAANAMDLPGMRREQHEILVRHIPVRCYAYFCKNIFIGKRIRLHETNEDKIIRIDRFPKFIKDFAKKNKISLDDTVENYKFTPYKGYESEEVSLINQEHPLFKLAKGLTKQEMEKVAIGKCMIKYPSSEPLNITIYSVGITDGTGNELSSQLIYLAKRSNNEVIVLDHYWLFQCKFEGDCIVFNQNADTLSDMTSLKESFQLRYKIKKKRETQLEKVSNFLQKNFEAQYNDTLEKLTQYQNDNVDNKNTILINQMNAALIDIELRKEERLSEVERQRNIIMKPPKVLAQLELVPNGKGNRVISSEYKKLIKNYEESNGRKNIISFNTYALVDFYSERYNGDPRFIIVSNSREVVYSNEYYEDLNDIFDCTYVYYVDDEQNIVEYLLKNI